MPGAAVAEDLLHDAPVVNSEYHAHGAGGVRSAECGRVPGPEDKITPALGVELALVDLPLAVAIARAGSWCL